MTDRFSRRILRIDPDAKPLAPLGLSAKDFQSALPVQNYRLVFEDETIGLAVGIWDTTTMQEAFGPYPSDEFITVLDGRFGIVDAAGAAVSGEAGQSVTFRMGIPVSWKQEGYLRKIYLTLHDPSGAMPEIASAEGGVQVLAPDTRTGDDCVFRNDRGTMVVRLCAGALGLAPVADGGLHRLIRVLEGTVTLTGADGRAEALAPGDHVFLPAGTPCEVRATADARAFVVCIAAAQTGPI